jgi:hypothetical protein
MAVAAAAAFWLVFTASYTALLWPRIRQTSARP